MEIVEKNGSVLKNKDEFSLYHYVKKNWKNILIFLLLALLIAFYVWKNIALKNQNIKSLEKYDKLYDASVEFSKTQNKYYLEIIAHTFSLAIISEISRKNLENVNLYLTSLLKKDNNIIEIMVSNEQDIIIASTNKKQESRSLREYFPVNYINLKRVVIMPDKDLMYQLIIAPLYVINEQKGTLIIKYKPQLFSYKGNNEKVDN